MVEQGEIIDGPAIVRASKVFACVFLASLIFVALTLYVAPDGLYSSLFDDAMISFRYARNIADGVGPYWNQGDRVEGFTNPLWTYLMSTIYLLSGSRERLAPLLVQLVCAFLLASNCFVFSVSADRCRSLALSCGCSPALVHGLWLGASLSPVLFYPNIYWTLMGMEVALLTLLASLLFLLSFESDVLGEGLFARPASRNASVFVICVVGQLTRPDFLLVPASILGIKFLFVGGASRRGLLQLIASGFSGVAAGAVALYGWRAHYFDASMPNTYLLKVQGVDLLTQLVSGIGFVWPMIMACLPFLLLLAVVFFGSDKQGRGVLASSSAYFVFALLYQIRVGGDPWPYWRTFSAAFVLLGFSAFICLMRSAPMRLSLPLGIVGRRWSAGCGPLRLSVAALLGLTLLVANLSFVKSDFLSPLWGVLRRGDQFGVYTVASNRTNIDSAIELSRILPKGSRIGVFWAGTIPYYMSDYYAVDFLGKSDAHIASLRDRGGVSWSGMKTVPGHNKYDLPWSVSHYNPDWVQYSRWGNDDLENDPVFAGRYQFCKQTNGFLRVEFMDRCEQS